MCSYKPKALKYYSEWRSAWRHLSDTCPQVGTSCLHFTQSPFILPLSTVSSALNGLSHSYKGHCVCVPVWSADVTLANVKAARAAVFTALFVCGPDSHSVTLSAQVSKELLFGSVQSACFCFEEHWGAKCCHHHKRRTWIGWRVWDCRLLVSAQQPPPLSHGPREVSLLGAGGWGLGQGLGLAQVSMPHPETESEREREA